MKKNNVSLLPLVRWVALGASLFGVAGCASLDRAGTKLEMMASRVAEGKEHTYEGKIESIQKFGSMTSMAFTDGKMFDVEEAHAELYPGDVVRLYQTQKGLEARLWRSREDVPNSAEALR